LRVSHSAIPAKVEVGGISQPAAMIEVMRAPAPSENVMRPEGAQGRNSDSSPN
jgi:hypothetical protein